MHRLFFIAELLENICQHLRPADLASLARTSRTLFTPAVTRLYRACNTRTLMRIWRVFLDIGSPSLHDLTTRHLALSQRLTLYVRLIRHMDLFRHDTFDGANYLVDIPEFTRDLTSFLPKPILPSLRSLQFSAVHSIYLSILQELLSTPLSFLKVLRIRYLYYNSRNEQADDSARRFIPILELIPRCSPNLVELEIDDPWIDVSVISDAYVEVIKSLRSLTRFSSTTVGASPAVLSALGQKNGLLSFSCSPNLPHENGRSHTALLGSHLLQTNLFTSLQAVSLDLPRTSSAVILRSISSSQLQSVKLNMQYLPSECSDAVQALAREISRFQDLKTLDLSWSQIYYDIHDIHDLSWYSFAPILQCPKISCFSLASPRDGTRLAAPMTNEDLAEIAARWPQLSQLILRVHSLPRPSEPRTQLFSLKGLASLAACPKLEWIFVDRLNCLDVDAIDCTSCAKPSSPMKLEISSGAIKNAPKVANILGSLWEPVELRYHGQEHWREIWYAVAKHLAARGMRDQPNTVTPLDRYSYSSRWSGNQFER